MKRRGKAIAFTAVTLGLAVLSVGVMASKDRIAEEWWIYKLQNGEPGDQVRAAKRLGDLTSFRAMPVLLDVAAITSKEIGASIKLGKRPEGGQTIMYSCRGNGQGQQFELWEAALKSVAKVIRVAPAEAKPFLLQAAKHPSDVVRAFVCDVLEVRWGYAEGILRELLEDKDAQVRALAGHALEAVHAP